MADAKWVPIKRGKPTPKSINEKYRGLIDVELALDRQPPAEWAQAFLNPVNVPISISMHPPKLVGSTVVIQPPDNELDAYVKHVDVRIDHANQRYEHEFLPEIEAARERDQRQHDEDQQRLDDARKRSEEL